MSILLRSIGAWTALLCAVLCLAAPAAGQVSGLSMPGGFEVTNMGDGVRAYLRWTDTSATETHFEIVREKASGVVWGDQAVLTAPKDSVNKMDTPGAGLFRYRMRAVNAAGGSLYTAWTFCQIEMVLPTAPWNLTFTDMGDGERARLTWMDRSNNESQFEIIRQRQSSSGVWYGDTVIVAAANTQTLVNHPGVGSFRYRIRSVNAAGGSAWSGWVNGVVAPVGSSGGNTVAPSAPSNLEAINLGDGVRAYVRWDDNSDNEDGFRVFRDQLIAGAWAQDGMVELEANATNLTDSPGPGTFRYVVRAFNDIGASGFSNTGVIAVELVAPTVPTDLAFTDLGDGMRARLTWTDRSNNEDGFEILRQRQNASGAWYGDTVLLASANTETINNMPGPGTLRYRIRSTNSAGASAWSPWVVGIVADIAPTAPSGLAAADMGNQVQVQLTWTDNSNNESGFEIERETQAGAAWGSPATVTAGANTESLVDSAGTGTHRYRIRSVNAVGSSAFGAWVMVGVGGQSPPAAPSNTAVISLQNGVQARVTWADNSADETGFEIERQTEQTFIWGPTVTLSASAGSQMYTDAPGLGTHRYRVRAIGAGGASAFTAWVEVSITSLLPAAPSNLAAVSLNDGVRARLTWADNSSNETGFEIERQTLSGTTWGGAATLNAGANATLLVDAAGPGTHRYRIRAVNAAGHSAFTGWAQVDIAALAPAAPSGLTATSLNDGLRARVDWTDNSSDETGFQIERQTQAGANWGAVTMISTPANAETYTDSPGTGTHRYRVRAVNLAGQSPYTAWAQVSVTGSAPAAPSGLQAVDAGNRRALLSWNDNSNNETRFDIERLPAFSGGTMVVSANVTGYIDNCGAGTFQYRVRAANSTGVSAWTGWVSVVVQDIVPAAPSGLTLVDLGNQSSVRLNWIDNSDNETGFNIERQTSTAPGAWGPTSPMTALANATMLTNGPGPGTHRYRISAVNSIGSSAWTAWGVVTVSSGWTQFTPSVDTRKVYVSAAGNDSNTGFSEQFPKRTIAAGYGLLRDGYPDWLLLRRGDTFVESINWQKSGRSVQERMMIGTYGTAAARPRVHSGTAEGFQKQNGPENHVAITGLHFFAHTYTGNGGSMGINWAGPGDDILIEDCYVEGYGTGMVIQGGDSGANIGRPSNIVIRRCVIVDNYCFSAHSQGIFAHRLDNLLIEECIFDKNGFKEGVAEATIYNHNLYLNNGCTGVVYRRNISVDAASHGLQQRTGGLVQDSLFVRNAIGLLFGGGTNPNPAGVSGTVEGNVILEGKDIIPSLPRGHGIDLKNLTSATVRNNIIANKLTSNPVFAIGSYVSGGDPGTIGVHNAVIENNIVYNWRGPIRFNAWNLPATYSGNIIRNNVIMDPTPGSDPAEIIRTEILGPAMLAFNNNRYYRGGSSTAWFDAAGPTVGFSQWCALSGDVGSSVGQVQYPDPGRSLGSYAGTIGLTPTHDALMAALRAQSRANWRSDLETMALLSYFRAGFAAP